MATAIEIAACISNEMGSLTTMKLQKLVFYSQAKYLVEYGEPLFEERIEAWANGPVVRELFLRHRGEFIVLPGKLGPERLQDYSARIQAVVNEVIGCFGDKTGAELSELTHSELPWKDARHGLSPSVRSNAEITRESIKAFYSSSACHNPLFA